MSDPVGQSSSRGTTKGNATATVLRAIGDTALTQERYFKEALESKSILLNNLKQQTTAAKSVTRAKSRVARKHCMSRTKMKSAGLIQIDPSKVYVDEFDVRRTHLLWKQFMISLMLTCSNNAQLQSKLHEVGLLGAHLRVLETNNLNLSQKANAKKFSGFVVNETSKCIFLALLPEEESFSSPSDVDKKKVIVKRLLKQGATYAVMLPPPPAASSSSSSSSSAKEQSKVLVLHGLNMELK